MEVRGAEVELAQALSIKGRISTDENGIVASRSSSSIVDKSEGLGAEPARSPVDKSKGLESRSRPSAKN